MSKNGTRNYGPARITSIVVFGSLCVAILLATLLITYDIVNGTLVRFRFWIACFIIIYLLAIRLVLKKGRINTANWLLILLYEGLATVVLLHWGLSSVIGIITACFVVLLPGVLVAPRSIAPVTLVTFCVLIAVYLLHTLKIIVPVRYISTSTTTPLDVIAICTILSVFALVSWVSARQTSLSLLRALKAEESVRQQKNLIAIKLEEESLRLRETQLQQIQQLYRFAIIGQSATATLHELSNHLSILNLDIDDIKQQHRYSKAISNAKNGIEAINFMVKKAREQLNAESQANPFNAVPVIRRAVSDIAPKFHRHQVKLSLNIPRGIEPFSIHGGPGNLTQCISILLNNALDACKGTPNPHVILSLFHQHGHLLLTISDNGPGIKNSIQKTLFQPLESTKPSGLGVGLYIAKQLIEYQFEGSLQYIPSKVGATFEIRLNKNSRKTKSTSSLVRDRS